jgi:hypothetical protein
MPDKIDMRHESGVSLSHPKDKNNQGGVFFLPVSPRRDLVKRDASFSSQFPVPYSPILSLAFSCITAAPSSLCGVAIPCARHHGTWVMYITRAMLERPHGAHRPVMDVLSLVVGVQRPTKQRDPLSYIALVPWQGVDGGLWRAGPSPSRLSR